MMRMLHMGDLDVALPIGAGLGVWLLAAGAGRTALRWGACFAGALLLVGATKIAHLAWDTDLDLFDFKAISGHATVVTALYPIAAWALLYHRGRAAALTGLAAGLLVSIIVATLLVTSGEHTIAEAAAGWSLGAAVSLAGCARSADLAQVRLQPAIWWTLPAFALSAWLMQSAHIGYWMIRLALVLSDDTRPYVWDACSI